MRAVGAAVLLVFERICDGRHELLHGGEPVFLVGEQIVNERVSQWNPGGVAEPEFGPA